MAPVDENWDAEERSIYDRGRADAAEERKVKLKRSDVLAMSTREAADRKPEIDKAMREGFAAEEDE